MKLLWFIRQLRIQEEKEFEYRYSRLVNMLVEDIGYEMKFLAPRAGSLTMSYRSDRSPKAHKTKWDIFIAL